MNLDTPGDTIIMGKKASLRIPSTDCWNGSVGGPLKIYRDIGGQGVVTEIPILRDDSKGLFYQKIRSFLDEIKAGGTAPIPTSQILYNQAILDGIVKSSELGREIEINIPEA
jgi:predicted dehydrogenase